MKTQEYLYKIIGLTDGEDYGEIKAKEFEDIIANKLKKHGKVERQVSVDNRGDGHGGKIDLVFQPRGMFTPWIAIEIDRKTPRDKSLFKIKYYSHRKGYIILRSPYKLIEI